MRLQKLSDGSLRLSRMNPWEVQTLRSLPVLADFSGHEAAERRLLPSPAVEADLTPEMAMDWVEFVVPELRDSFADNLGVVMQDLSGLKRHDLEPVAESPLSGQPAAESSSASPSGEKLGKNGAAPETGTEPEPEPDANADAASATAEGPPPPPVMDYFTVDIPAAHSEAWFRAMNQARLVLSAKHGIDSENLPDLASLLTSGKLEHWFQYELFVSLQGRLIDMVLDPETDDELTPGANSEFGVDGDPDSDSNLSPDPDSSTPDPAGPESEK